MNSSYITILILTMMIYLIQTDSSYSHTRHRISRHKRKLPLLFHDFGVSQFVCGFGVPVDLDLETVTTGIVFKSQLPLPAAPADLRNSTTHNINGRSTQNSMFSTLKSHMRLDFYKILESWAASAGFNGRSCVFKTLCEVAENPFSSETGDLWHDIAYILFTPLSSVDEMSNHQGSSEYLAASRIGLSGVNSCDAIFEECPKSLLTVFSQIF